MTLNDVATVLAWLNDEALELCNALECMGAMELLLSVALCSFKGRLTLPFKLPTVLWAFKLITRVMGHREYTSSIIQGVERVRDVRFVDQVMDRLSRVSY